MTSEDCLWVFRGTVLTALALVIGVSAQQENAPIQTANSPDVVTVSDGTPITLRFEKALSSADAKVGDPVQFTVAAPVLADAFVVVPSGTAVSGTIVAVRHRGHFGKNGEFSITINDLALPVGKSLSVRQDLESRHNHHAGKVAGEVTRAVVESVPFFGVTLPMMAVAMGFEKGVEQVYPAGSLVTAYINGPIAISRNGLTPYQEPHEESAQVFFKNEECTSASDCDPVNLKVGKDFLVGELVQFLCLELRPGTYSFSTDKTESALQLELLANRQYWVERKQKALVADDPEHHRDEIDTLKSYRWIIDRNLVYTVLPLP
jgi:hypothetical protein